MTWICCEMGELSGGGYVGGHHIAHYQKPDMDESVASQSICCPWDSLSEPIDSLSTGDLKHNRVLFALQEDQTTHQSDICISDSF